MFLYHYFDKTIGAFRNLSDLPSGEADLVLRKIKSDKPSSQAARRDAGYMKRRIYYEELEKNVYREGWKTRKAGSSLYGS
ncbi:MAG: hypothetical protein K0R50_203 [Eubacterium sp.]|jgi:hypothetical protein|nr:hypothetical protein [Eubacterium sp.]